MVIINCKTMDIIQISIGLSWLLFIYLRVYEDGYLYKKHIRVNHSNNAVLVIILSTIDSLIYTYWYKNGNFIDLLYLEFTLWTIYWILFDIGYNKFVGFTWDYLGRTAKLDLFLRKYAFGKPLLFKLACLVFLNICYYCIDIIEFIKILYYEIIR